MSEATIEKKGFTVKDLAFTAMFSVIIAVCSWISVPFEVPFTLQTFGIFCAALMLGGKRSFFSVLVYILLGLVGVPVFAGFSGGAGVLFGTTGGYIIGFLIIPVVYWLFTKFFGEKLPVIIAALVIGLALCYTFGTVWFILVYIRNSGAIGLATALGWCVFPFIIPDLVKMALAIILAKRLEKHVKL